ncbi:MAG: sulfatase-like hydrolase/transferase [Chloroflexi bacterium]|nr:sulfatase-like hydrolase/transferase [Chloroflexota bacterium]
MTPRRPNVLLIFTDQQRFDTLGAINNPVIRTPSLDRLARSGVVFTSAYTPSPVCVPARCSLTYGQYPYRTGCYDNRDPMPEDGRRSLVDALTEAGYRTHGIGKCHFTPDSHARRGFQTRERQEELVATPDNDDYLRFLHARGFPHVCDPHGIRGEMYYIPQPAQMPAELHPTQWIGDRSLAFIEERADEAQPWFLFASFVHPHPPFAPPNPWHKLYRAPLMPLPKVPPDCDALLTHINRRQNRYKYRDQGLDQNLLRTLKAYYYACISFVDYQVGRILDVLEKTGQIDHTLILFTADHGEHLGDYNCFGKRSMHDSCARVPLIARMPGRFEGGRVCDRPASLVDVAPTVLTACGGEMPSPRLDGVDLADVASGAAGRAAVFSQFQREGQAIYTAVTARWKYAYSAADDREFLFDRVEDPQETRNRAGLLFCRDALAGMRQMLITELRAAGETAGLDGERWKGFPREEVPADPDSGLLVQDHRWAETRIPGYTLPCQ